MSCVRRGPRRHRASTCPRPRAPRARRASSEISAEQREEDDMCIRERRARSGHSSPSAQWEWRAVPVPVRLMSAWRSTGCTCDFLATFDFAGRASQA